MADMADIAVGVAVVDGDVTDVANADRTVAAIIGDVKAICSRHRAELGHEEYVYFMHCRASEEMFARCSNLGASATDAKVRDTLMATLAEAKEQYGAGQVRDARETLQQCFIEMNSKATGTRAVVIKDMPSVTTLLAEKYPEIARADDYPKGSMKLKMSTVRGAIELCNKTTKNYLDEDKNAAGAAYVLKRAVEEMINHIDPSATLAVDALKVIKTKAELAHASEDSEVTVKDLMKMLVQVAREEVNPGLSPGMSHPINFATEPAFPDKAKGGGCCVIA